MSISNKIFYNEASAVKLGWDPSWFGVDEFDDELIEKIKQFQAKYDLGVDGLCGPITYRHMITEREANAHHVVQHLSKFVDDSFIWSSTLFYGFLVFLFFSECQ